MKKHEIEVSEGKKQSCLFCKIVKAAAVIAAVKGAVYITKSVITQKAAEREKKTKNASQPEFYAFMVGRHLSIEGEEFKGAAYTTVMGGFDVDLSKAVIKEDVSVICRNVMGGINIKVPNDVNVSVSGCNFMGGIANMVPENRPGATIYLRAECVMGGVCVRTAGVEEDTEKEPEKEAAESKPCEECTEE